MKTARSAKSRKWITTSWPCMERGLDSNLVYRDSNTTPESMCSKKTPRSRSSFLVKRLMTVRTKTKNKRSTSTLAMDNNSILVSDVESSFVAGRQNSVFDVSPVSCPPTPPIYTPTCEHPSKSNAFFTACEEPNTTQGKPSQETLSVEGETSNLELNQKQTRPNMAISMEKIEAERSPGRNSRQREIKPQCQRPSPPEIDTLTTIHEQSPREFSDFLETHRNGSMDLNMRSSRSVRSQQSGPQSLSTLISVDSPSRIYNTFPSPSFKSFRSKKFMNNLSPKASKDSRNSRYRCPEIHAMASFSLSSARLLDTASTLKWKRSYSSRVQTSFHGNTLGRGSFSEINASPDLASSFSESIDLTNMNSSYLRPIPRLNLNKVQQFRSKSRCRVSSRETLFSMDEGILNTESEVFLDNDLTSPTPYSGEPVELKRISGGIRTEELFTTHRQPIQLQSVGNTVSSGKIERCRRAELMPFCFCLGSWRTNSFTCA